MFEYFRNVFFILSSTESPRIDVVLPIHQLVNETDTFEIFCNATGHPTPTVSWTKVGNNGTIYPTGVTLRVEKADKSDFGTYKCTAVSVRGENVTAEASVELDHCESMLSHLEFITP